jgi:hypothetical protein
MMAELNSKLISRSIFGFELAVEVIFSRSSVDSERVGRFRKAAIKRVSSAARAALAGDVVKTRVTRGGFRQTGSAIAAGHGFSPVGAKGIVGASPAFTNLDTKGLGRCDGHHEDGECPGTSGRHYFFDGDQPLVQSQLRLILIF